MSLLSGFLCWAIQIQICWLLSNNIQYVKKHFMWDCFRELENWFKTEKCQSDARIEVVLKHIFNINTYFPELLQYQAPLRQLTVISRDVHRNFEGQLLCPGKKGQHVHFCHRRRHAPVPWTHILPISLETLTNRRRHAPVPWTLIPRLFYLGLHEVLQP